MATPETIKEGLIEERAEEATPLNIERKEVATPTPSNFSAQVYIDPGNSPTITTPQSQNITITIPDTPESLKLQTRGSDEDSKTWVAYFFIRLINQARLLGNKIVVQKK